MPKASLTNWVRAQAKGELGKAGEGKAVAPVVTPEQAEIARLRAEAAKIWRSEERLEFSAWIAREPDAGTVIPGSSGCRKVRWSRPGMGKQGGARVIYFTHLAAGELCMLLVYPKAVRDNFPSHILRQIREEIEDERT